jgi:YVTN family beta-propeller protein
MSNKTALAAGHMEVRMMRTVCRLQTRAKTSLVTIVFVIVFVNLLGCSGGGGGSALAPFVPLIPLIGATSPATVPLVVFPGGEALKPAVLLPFSGEVNAVTVTPDGHKLYVADSLHNTVSVVDLPTRTVIAVLDVPTGPRFLTVTPDGGKVLVSSFGNHLLDGNTVSIIDTVNDSVREILTVGAKPIAIAVMPDNSKAFVLNSADNSVSVIDLVNDSISKTINAAAGFAEPVAVVLSSDGSRAFVANRGSNDVAVINTQTEQVVQNVGVGETPTGLALLPDDSKLYVSNRDDDTISVLHTSTGMVEDTLAVSTGPMALVASMDGRRVYVAHAFSGNERDLCGIDGNTLPSNRISVIDVASGTVLPAAVTVGNAPLAVAVTGDNKKLYSVSACADPATGKGAVSSLDTTTITGNANAVANSIETVARGTGLVLSPDSFRVFVTHPHAVSVLNVASDTILGSPISVRGAGPTKLALTTDGTKLYTINTGSDSVSVIDVDPASDDGQFLASLTVGSRPSDLAITTRLTNNQVVVTNAGYSRTPDNRISLIDVTGPWTVDDTVDMIELTDQVNLNTGRGPVAVAISSDNTKAFVANFGDFFPNERAPGSYLSQVDLQTFEVTNFGNHGEWLLSVTIDPETSLAGNGNVVKNVPNEDVIHVANFLGDTLSRTKVSDPLNQFAFPNKFEEFVRRPIDVALSDSRMVVAGYETNYVNNEDHTPIYEVAFDGVKAITQLDVVGANPGRILVTPNEASAFVLHSGDRSFVCGFATFCEIGNTVSAIALPFSNTVASVSIPVGKRPTGIAFTPDKAGVPKRAYVTNYFDGTVTVIEPWVLDAVTTPTVVRTLKVEKGPSGVVVNAAGTRAYVANSISNSISVISIEGSIDTVVGTIVVSP